jgi:hypothetical protein
MRIKRTYLAERYSRRVELQTYVPLFAAVGLHVEARWLDGKHEPEVPDEEETPEFIRACALEDLHDVAAASVMVLFTEHPDAGYTRGGRHVEFGYALALGLRCIVIGRPENVFHHLATVECYPSLGAFLDAERERAAA